MLVAKTDALEKLAQLIHASKEGVNEADVTPEKSLVNDFGFDSLDTLQLSRKITRVFGDHFELDTWAQREDSGTVQSIIDHLYAEEGTPAPAA